MKKTESKLKQIRESAGLSQWKLSLESGVNFRMIQHYEQGTKDLNKANVATVSKLAEALNCDIYDLVDKVNQERKEYLAIGKWKDQYTGAGIYSLIDQDGKRYIGQALNVQRRLDQHRIELNKVVKGLPSNETNLELIDAVMDGKRFHVEILKKLEGTEATKNNLCVWEDYFFEKYGGFNETYNGVTVSPPRWNYEPFNVVHYNIELKPNEDADIIAFLESQEDSKETVKRILREYIEKK